MKKITIVCMLSLLGLAACCHCEKEPIVEQNHKLIVPPDFGSKPAK